MDQQAQLTVKIHAIVLLVLSKTFCMLVLPYNSLKVPKCVLFLILAI